MKDSQFLSLLAAGYSLESEHVDDQLAKGRDEVIERLITMAHEAKRRETLLERYPEATPVSLVKLVLPQPIRLSQKLDLHERFPHFSSLLDEGYGQAEFMAFADAAMGECYALFIEHSIATGRSDGIRSRPWFEVLDDLRETEVRKIRRALGAALSREFPEEAARIGVNIGYAMGVEDESDY